MTAMRYHATTVPFHRVPPPLAGMVYSIARDGADEEVEQSESGVWAGMLRSGEDVTDRVQEWLDAEKTDLKSEKVNQDDWENLRASSGVIVTKDRQGIVLVRSFAGDAELEEAWSALLAVLEPEEPGPPTVQSPESDNNPT